MQRKDQSTSFLPFRSEVARVRDVTVRAQEVTRMIEALSGRGWVKAAVLTRETGFNSRHLRALANASDGQVLGHSEGYGLTRELDDDAADRVERRLVSQAKRMMERAVAIRRVRNHRPEAA